MNNIWVEGYEGLYTVSDCGDVFSCRRNGEVRKLKGGLTEGRYLNVTLTKEGKGKTFLVHRLVANAFIPNTDNKPCVDHIDEDKANNTVGNLRWCTPQENTEYYCTKDGRRYQAELARGRKEKLVAYSKELQKVRKELNKERKELQKVEEDLVLAKANFSDFVDKQIGSSKEKYEGYMETSGAKFTTVDELVELTGKPVNINGIEFISCGTAASYIVKEELKLGTSRNKATISKELRRYLQGRRPPGSMYKRYDV